MASSKTFHFSQQYFVSFINFSYLSVLVLHGPLIHNISPLYIFCRLYLFSVHVRSFKYFFFSSFSGWFKWNRLGSSFVQTFSVSTDYRFEKPFFQHKLFSIIWWQLLEKNGYWQCEFNVSWKKIGKALKRVRKIMMKIKIDIFIFALLFSFTRWRHLLIPKQRATKI